MTNRIFQTWRDPYGECFSTCRKKQIQINSGLTVLVGCNGAGKTTLLNNIKNCLEKDKIPYLYFDNQSDGHSSNTYGSAIFNGDYGFISESMSSSEGENITLNICNLVSEIRNFIITGETAKSIRKKRWDKIFRDDANENAENEPVSNERWILFDAIDSGYSIDNVIELKGLFSLMFEDAANNGVDFYIVVSANEYELASGENCFDVMSGSYVSFSSYEEFKKFILNSRAKKNKRNESAKKKMEKLKEKERQREEQLSKEEDSKNIKKNKWRLSRN